MRVPPQSHSVDRTVTTPMGIGAKGVQPAFFGGLLSAALPILKRAGIGALRSVVS